MINIQSLTTLTLSDFERTATGYTAHKKYVVTYADTGAEVSFRLEAVALERPFHKEWTFDDETVARYTSMLSEGYSFGAYDNDLLIGLIIAEPQTWNHSLWVWEFHVAADYRHEGIGRRLMERVAAHAKESGFRILVCETQNTNADGIDIYRRLSFRLEGVDISYYTNEDYPDGEVAVFMKRRLV